MLRRLLGRAGGVVSPRAGVVLAVVLAQGALLVGMQTWVIADLRREMNACLSGPLTDALTRDVRHLVEQLEAEVPPELAADPARGWARARLLMEREALAGEAKAVLLDADGRVTLGAESLTPAVVESLTYRGLAGAFATPDAEGEPARLARWPRETLAVGTLRGPEPAQVAAAWAPRLERWVAAVQPTAPMALRVEAATWRVAWHALGLTALVMMISVLGMRRMLRRHDRRLEGLARGLERELWLRVEQAERTNRALVRGLGGLAESRDNDTGLHLQRLVRFSTLIAHALRPTHPEVTPDFLHKLEVAAALHDIGKVAVPDAVLLKAGKLDPAERTRMQQHTLVGVKTLLAVRAQMGNDDLLDAAVQVAGAHHERWDGGGYPFGLAGDEIPLAARIVSVADVYDALTSRRVYKPALGHEEAVAMIVRERGKQFDPGVVDAFEAVAHQIDQARAQTESPAGALDAAAAMPAAA